MFDACSVDKHTIAGGGVKGNVFFLCVCVCVCVCFLEGGGLKSKV